MIDKIQAERILFRIAVAALNYYPDKPHAEPGFDINEDIDWCLDAFEHLPAENRDRMRERIAEVITDPTTHREQFVRDVLDLIAPVTVT